VVRDSLLLSVILEEISHLGIKDLEESAKVCRGPLVDDREASLLK
jgi:hypothetical protein